jgi:hypothetical protein
MRPDVRGFIALGAVPSEWKHQGFDFLKEEHNTKQLKPLVEYFEKQWLNNSSVPLEMWDFSLSVVFTINLSKARHKWYKADMALIPQKNVYAVVRMFHSRYRRQLLQIERELGPAPLPRRQRGEHWQKEDLLWDCINKFKEQSFTKEGCLEFLDNIARLIHAVDSIWKKARSASHKKPVCSGSDQSCKPAADALYASSRATGAIEERSRRYEEKRSRRCKEKISCSEAQCPCCQERRGPAEVT